MEYTLQAVVSWCSLNGMVYKSFLATLFFFSLGVSLMNSSEVDAKTKAVQTPAKAQYETAILAGGCFWGVEDLFRAEKGVIKTEVGYTGGTSGEKAKYEFVKQGNTGHAESIKITFDPSVLTYKKLLLFFFEIHDPTTINQQGNDRGSQYRSEIFYLTDAQKKDAEEIKARVDKSGQWKKPVVTVISKSGEFYSAEEYHQKYLVKNPGGYTCHWNRKLDF
ncbi:MAG: peptide-methionine (S)-S-oxide reductase MsrA [Bdellovibrionaceae bacterium]|nr:peptide-methionine (S)-S-oxide reductase MsrA [Pseudobdellovibrionaceae bacterium]